MLFRREFHQGLRSGEITLSFRTWRTPHAKPGGRYRLGRGEEVEVLGVERVRVGALRDADARRAGFADRTQLLEFLRRGARAPLGSATEIFRVELRYAGRPPGKRRPSRAASPAELDSLVAHVDAMERRAREPWAWRTLETIGRKPRVRAADLARALGRETLPWKVDVRKLKRLGLTLSHEVGYELTPLGRSVLRVHSERRQG
jgi:hypothetical protein